MTQTDKAQLPEEVRALIIDMDGVLWRANEPIGDLPFVFSRFEQRGLKVLLATNNSTRTPAQYLEKLRGFGVNLREEQILTSSEAAALYLRTRFPAGGPVYIIGEDGLHTSLASNGFHPYSQDNAEIAPLAVVVGMDREINYQKLTNATLLIRAGTPFIATNPDTTFPTPEGLAPGAGAILAAIEVATGVQPYVLGKPFSGMYEVALQRLEISAQQALAIGDRLETDIAGAQALGCHTALVLSGVTSPDEAHAWAPPPNFIASDLTSLVQTLGI